jgi:hypothetical protein
MPEFHHSLLREDTADFKLDIRSPTDTFH